MLEHDDVSRTGDGGGQTADGSDGTSTLHPKLVILPDSPDTRLLVDLTSHANDLSEAVHSLGNALDSGEGSELWQPLTSHAVTAYIRPFIHSNVRIRLDQMPGFPGIPADLRAIHDLIRKYRNTTVAHSQSNLVMPLPAASLDDAGRARRVWGMTLTHQMPLVIAERFAFLLMTVEAIVEDATQPVIERLRTWTQTQTPEVIRGWPGPEIAYSVDDDFNASERRTRIPRFTNYFHVEEIHGNTIGTE